MKHTKNWPSCKGLNPWIWSKNGHFSNFFFLGNKGQANVFYDILERRNAFLRYKNKKLKKTKKLTFFQRGWPLFLFKYDHFFNCVFLGKIGRANVFYDIVERRNAFLGYKNNKMKKSKNWHLSKGVNPWFWFKNGHYFNIVFSGNIGQGNIFHDILQRKNAFLG